MYDGIDRRKSERYCEGHIQLCEDVAVIKNTLLTLDKRINSSLDKYGKHLDESVDVRDMVSRHDETLKSMKGAKAASITTLVTVITAIVGFAVVWGGLRNQVEVNTKRLDRVELRNK